MAQRKQPCQHFFLRLLKSRIVREEIPVRALGAGGSPVILATWKAEIGRIVVRGQPRQIVQETPSPKNQTRAGGVVQVVECLPSKHETPSLNPSTEKRKKERKNNQTEWTSSEDQALQV
jgi:hypothetical protein